MDYRLCRWIIPARIEFAGQRAVPCTQVRDYAVSEDLLFGFEFGAV